MKEERGFQMKKLLALLLAAALLCLAGCSSMPSLPTRFSIPGSEPSEPVSTSSDPAPETQYDDSLLYESYAEEWPWSDSNGDSGVYSVHLPAIASDAPGAQELNAQIDSVFRPVADEMLANAEAGTWGQYLSISWESHWSGSIVTLVIISETSYAFTDYMTYSYDFSTDEVLNGAETVQRTLGLAYSSLMSELRRSAAQYFDRMYAGVFGTDEYDFLTLLRAWTLMDDNLASAMFFLDDTELYAIMPIGSVAGASWYYHVVPVTRELLSTEPLSAAYDFVEATLTDGSLLVTFSDTGSARDWNADLDYGVPYEVENCYGVYVDMRIARMSFGLDSSIYLLLLTQDGTVEFVNLLGGARYGMLSCGGPVLTLGNISALTADETTVYALDADGTPYDLNEIVPGLLENYIPETLTGTWTAQIRRDPNSSEESACRVELHGDAFLYMEETAPDGSLMRTDGNLRYIGMDGGGLVYTYFLTGDMQVSGVLRLMTSDYGDLLVRPLFGADLFDAGAGGFTAFERG